MYVQYEIVHDEILHSIYISDYISLEPNYRFKFKKKKHFASLNCLKGAVVQKKRKPFGSGSDTSVN